MTIQLKILGAGDVSVSQTFDSPIVYFDHWAVRMFSDDLAIQPRFVHALKAAGGTLFFSSHNLAEFCALNDIDCATRAEKMLDRLLPNIAVVDMTADPEFKPLGDVLPGEGPKPYWLLDDLAARAKIAGALTTFRFVSDSVLHSDQLHPIFADMADSIAAAVNADRAKPERIELAKNFRPKQGMNAYLILRGELLRDVYLNASAAFTSNDASDLVHAVSALLHCDYVLLDNKWCHKARVARQRLKRAGFRARLAESFSAKANGIGEFLRALELKKRH